MTLKLHNTKTRQKEEFTPIDADNVRMYVCGPTVYDQAHIGNARPVIVFDVLFRLLRHIYGEDHVTYARNITDIDDKIMARAARDGKTIAQVTKQTTAVFHADVAALGALPPSLEPRATDHVAQMVEMISKLIKVGNAYEAEGHVLFQVSSMADYGKLSGRSTDDMIAGARVEIAPYKRDAMDFVLWKPSSDEEPGWDSPWGRGRPGWHLECSAMIEQHLGQTIDIHGGGIDLVFPHHENEVAQSACVHDGAPLANYWVHNGFLQVEGEKMSKSLGNFRTIHDLLERLPGDALRLQMLSTHYRQPIDWTEDGAGKAVDTINQWRSILKGVEPGTEVPAKVLTALNDDLNTPAAITELHGLFDTARRSEEPKDVKEFAAALDLMGLLPVFSTITGTGRLTLPSIKVSGYGFVGKKEITPAVANSVQSSLESYWGASARSDSDSMARERNALMQYGLDPISIQEMIERRIEARAAKDFAEADRIRDELVAMGVEIMDGARGTTWKVAK